MFSVAILTPILSKMLCNRWQIHWKNSLIRNLYNWDWKIRSPTKTILPNLWLRHYENGSRCGWIPFILVLNSLIVILFSYLILVLCIVCILHEIEDEVFYTPHPLTQIFWTLTLFAWCFEKPMAFFKYIL